MGDFCAPKRSEVFDKIRRRLELYRHHHSEAVSRYFDARPSTLEQQNQDTLLLRQRWLESKAKKAAKQSKSSRDSNHLQSDHRNLVVTKLKRKIDSVSAEANTASTVAATSTVNTASETVFSFENNDHQPSATKNSKTNSSKSIGGGGGGTKHSTCVPSLSVQIVQQISTHCQQDTPHTIHTNVTVSSCYATDSPNAGTANHSIHTSVQCKQEPFEDSARSSANIGSSSIAHNSHIDPESVSDICIGIDDVDELRNILDSIEKDEDIDPSLLKDLKEFNEICEKYQRNSERNESGNMYDPLACSSPGLLKGVFPNLGPCGHMGSMFDNNQNMNTSAMNNNHTIPVPTAIPEPTGPAAETLKQMAAQHQHQHSPGYPMKSMDHYTDGLRNGSFSPNYPQLYRAVPNMASPFTYNHTSTHHMNDASQMTPEMAAAMTYGGTKPLTHFPNEQGQQHNSPSSLQQLQNQVQSHFKPSMTAPHQMQITQSQHMQLSHGPHSMQLSQTQQVQMQPSPQQQISLSQQQISLSQQQTFNMGQQQMVSEQMKMQMIEKMRMEQQHQQQAQQGRSPPQYMSRAPPPEYNIHHSARPHGVYPNSVSPNGNQNPLQTIQNLINKTSPYGAVKSEVPNSSSPGQTNSGMMSSQISAMQQQTMPVTMASNDMGNLSQAVRPQFHSQQHLQQPPGYSAVESSARAQSSSTYTGAIMRNQRPPNVNVGPDGLNISQSRNNSDWARSNLMQSSHGNMRNGIHNNSGCSPHEMVQSSSISAHMMQYQQHRPPHYITSTGGMAAAPPSNIPQVQQQQQVRLATSGQIRGGPGTSIVPSGSQMMMQHQGIQIPQQMNMHTSNSPYNMGHSSSGPGSVPPAGYNMGGLSPGSNLHSGGVSNPQTNGAQPISFSNQPSTANNQDEFLHFLDNPLSSEPMFESTADFSLFEDILNGK